MRTSIGGAYAGRCPALGLRGRTRQGPTADEGPDRARAAGVAKATVRASATDPVRKGEAGGERIGPFGP